MVKQKTVKGRPPGRARKGKVWDIKNGYWIDDEIAATIDVVWGTFLMYLFGIGTIGYAGYYVVHKYGLEVILDRFDWLKVTTNDYLCGGEDFAMGEEDRDGS